MDIFCENCFVKIEKKFIDYLSKSFCCDQCLLDWEEGNEDEYTDNEDNCIINMEICKSDTCKSDTCKSDTCKSDTCKSDTCDIKDSKKINKKKIRR